MPSIASRIDTALAGAGCDASDIPGRTELLLKAVTDFERTNGRPPAWAWWVPGRIEVFGKHTDYAGGRSLVAPVPRGFAVAAAPREDDVVAANDARWSTAMEVRTSDSSRTFHGWANYVAVVALRFAQNFPGAHLGADITFASDLPRAAGMSSSSALVVAMALALIRRGRLEARPEWRDAVRDRLELGGYLGAVENGLTFGTLAGTSGVGTYGGSEDHTAILNGRAGSVSAFSYVPTRPEGVAAVPADWRFVLMTSGVEAAKAGAARGRYNRASLGTRALLELWRWHTHDNSADTLAQVLAGGEHAESTLRTAIGRGHHAGFSPEDLAQRLSHFVAENGRVLPALTAFQDADGDALSALAAASQADAERLLGNQVAETSTLAALARNAGAFAASSFGAGFGGSVWALADAASASAVCERWQAAYLARYPGLRNVAGLVVRPGVPTVEVPLEG